jgi:hypothetical protein
MVIDLALMLDTVSRWITVGPRDEVSQRWLLSGGDIFVELGELCARYRNELISRRDLPRIAAELQQSLNDKRAGYERWAEDGRLNREHVTFRVRACEYRAVRIEQQLVEI